MAKSLPTFQGLSDTTFGMFQDKWASILDPVLKNAATDPVILKNVQLTAGSNNVNHLLGHRLTGWQVIRQRSAATFYDTQDTNPTPAQTLALNASANCLVDLIVF